MKIVLAPNALKSSLTAVEATDALAAGARAVLPDAELVRRPVTDGGDGLVQVLADGLQAGTQSLPVTGPTGKRIAATWLYHRERRMAVIESAAASGLALLDPAGPAPMTAHTRGTGELILAALDAGAQCILLGIGGSAGTDGGMGMAQALGVIFRDARGRPLEAGGGQLADVAEIDTSGLDARLGCAQVQVLCDVDNPLLGPQGTAAVFAAQKGASATQIQQLEAGLAQYADVLEATFGRELRNQPGAGAAGGLGAGALAFLGAELLPGAETVLDLLDFDSTLEGADLVITAEGQLDAQTAFGKAPAAVARRARAAGLPCMVIAGRLGEGADRLADTGITAIYALCEGAVSQQDAMQNAARHLRDAAARALREFSAGRKTGV